MTLEIHQGPSASTALQQASLADQMMYAERLAMAKVLPDSFRRSPSDVLVAIEVAGMLGVAPFTLMQDMAIIGGKPSYTAKFMRALARRAGHKVRETCSDGVARCVIIRSDDPDFEHVAEWDEAKARQHDLWGKGHWRKNPMLMLQNRALSECVRLACPEAMAGIYYTPDEVADFTPGVDLDAPAAVTVEQAPEAPKPDRATSQQMARIGALGKALGIMGRDLLAVAIEVTGRDDLVSALDMTPADADALIAELECRETAETEPEPEAEQPEGVDADTGEIIDADVLPESGDAA